MAKNPSIKNATLPSNLSWSRSLNVSEGEMFAIMAAGNSEIRVPVEVTETTIRGAMAAYSAGYDKKGEPLTEEALAKAQNPAQPNIQTIQLASLPSTSDTLDISYAMAFSGCSTRPDACNSKAFREQLDKFAEAATEAGLHAELASRYLWSIANSRALWRNALGTDKRVTLTDPDAGVAVSFTSNNLPLDAFPGHDALAEAAGHGNAVPALVKRIGEALSGGPIVRLSVVMRVRLYPGAEVWPSQEFPTAETTKRPDGREVKRVLSSKPAVFEKREIRHATMHSQKIGNALRTIDEWHGAENYRAVPVEAFGWVQRDLTAIRKPGVNDAYTLLRDVAGITERLRAKDAQARDAALYVLAMMIRGGVFPMSAAGDETVAAA